jgi:ankyrin repeat protein
VNVRDKRGQTPLHYAVEKQDYDMFLTLLDDPYIDPNQLELDNYFKPRRLSVIFSAFHKMLYKKEKHIMR